MPEHEMQAAEVHEMASEQARQNRESTNITKENLDFGFSSPNGNKEEKSSLDRSLQNPSPSDTHHDSEDASVITPDDEEPTFLEKQTLRRIGESLPLSAWLVAVVELSERFTFYGCQGIFQNYIQRPLDGSLGRGALGRGHQAATALTTFFSLWAYVTPIFGAIIADQYLGRYKTIVIFAGVYILGLLILFLSSLPVSLEHGAGMGGFIAAILVIGLATGGLKANISVLITEQYTRKTMAIKTLVSGERVIIDPAVTISRIYLIFYCCINIGSLSLLATPYMERDIGFYSAYLLCLCMFILGFICLILGRKVYVVKPPQGSVITNAFKAIGIMIKHRNMNAPKPSYQEEFGRNYQTPWDDQFIEELKRALIACRVFAFYPIYWVVYSQFSGNFVSQAAQMRGHGIPNDLMQNFDPISILFCAPILDQLLYPFLRRHNIKFGPIARISCGFIVASMSMLYAGVLQHFIYEQGPCYGHPLECPAAVDANGVAQGNNIHIAIQTPAYVFIGVSEILASVTGLEYAFQKAPPSMKSFVQAMFLLTNAFGYAIGEAFIPLVGDPKIMWLFVGLCCGSFATGCLFYATFRKLDSKEDEMNSLDAKRDKLENKKALAALEEPVGEEARNEKGV